MSFFHGIEVVEDNSGSRPIKTIRSSVIGLVGTADSADANIFPLNKPVLLIGEEINKIAALGDDGTLLDSVNGIFASGVGAMVIVIRVAADVDPVAEIANVIGGIDGITGERTGISALLDAQSEVQLKPKILIAPTFSNEITVANALDVVAEKLKAIAIIEGPSTTDAAVVTYASNFDSARLYLVDPRVLATKDGVLTILANSAYVAGHIVRIDNEYGWHYSPSNHVVKGVFGTERPIEYDNTSTCRANYLNENKIATIIHEDGFRLWGNYTLSSDSKWQFLSVRRTADMLNESIAIAHKWAVDRGITKTLVEDIVMQVNSYIRELVRQEKIIGGACWADPAANPASEVEQGNLQFDFDFTPVYPAQHITFKSRLTNGYLEEIFK